jgi:hypothetical protein
MGLINRLERLERCRGSEGAPRFSVNVIEAATREEWEREFARRVREAGESELVFTFRIGGASVDGEESEEAD